MAEKKPGRPSIVMLGVDAASMDVIQENLPRLPNFARLLAKGAHYPLASWGNIAAGRRMAKLRHRNRAPATMASIITSSGTRPSWGCSGSAPIGSATSRFGATWPLLAGRSASSMCP